MTVRTQGCARTMDEFHPYAYSASSRQCRDTSWASCRKLGGRAEEGANPWGSKLVERDQEHPTQDLGKARLAKRLHRQGAERYALPSRSQLEGSRASFIGRAKIASSQLRRSSRQCGILRQPRRRRAPAVPVTPSKARYGAQSRASSSKGRLTLPQHGRKSKGQH